MRRAWVMALLLVGPAARGDRNDFTLERLAGPPMTPGVPVDLASNQPLQSQFRSLMSEMAVVLAPELLTPADSLGWSGFNLSVDSRFTQISNNADYWRRGVRDVSSGFLSTIHVMARKGIWAPLPSFELGAGGAYLVDSSIFALQFYAKLGIQEGFHRLRVPSISLRGAVSQALGASQVDLTVVSTDLTVSKSVGLAGTVKLDPYLGANLLVAFARGQVIDTTPNIDAFQQGPRGTDLNSNVVFPDQNNILRWRLYAGARLVWSKLTLSAEFAWTFCNDRAIHCAEDDPGKVTDRSNGQAQISLSAGVLF